MSFSAVGKNIFLHNTGTKEFKIAFTFDDLLLTGSLTDMINAIYSKVIGNNYSISLEIKRTAAELQNNPALTLEKLMF